MYISITIQKLKQNNGLVNYVQLYMYISNNALSKFPCVMQLRNH